MNKKMNKTDTIKIYTLSTCIHCKALKKFLNDHNVKYDFCDVDLLSGAMLEKTIEEVRKINPDCSFPTIIIGNRIIIGFREQELREIIGL